MLLGSIIFVLVVLGLGTLATAGYLLFRRGWFWTWFKASFAMSLVTFSVFALFSLIDLLSYKQLLAETPIASISIYEKQDQHYDLTLIAADGIEQRFEVFGDQWQLDARILTWVGPVAVLGKKPIYRLDRLSGRYISLEQALNAKQSIYGLKQSKVIDVWQILQTVSGWIDASYGSAVYMPMGNGAVYSVNLTAQGMNARPVNSIAKRLMGEEE